ncbi:hypothetical protein [Nocardia sp. NBC_00403]|uniref:hypothetical protein n=1 Tax=Nocardia sp. NBC_00403 TaxID=2975990 RepID=UPI002E1C860D
MWYLGTVDLSPRLHDNTDRPGNARRPPIGTHPMKPTAIGYLRSDISGTAQNWDEIRMRSLAKRYGYDLAKNIVFTP